MSYTPPPAYPYRHPDGLIPLAEHTRLRNHLASKYGLTPAQLDAAVDTGPNGRTRRQVAILLRSWLHTLPKGP